MVHNIPDLNSLKSAWQDKYQAKKLLQANNSSANFQIQQGDRFLAQNQFTEAITCYRHALKIDPNSIKAGQQLAQAIRQQRKLSVPSNYSPQPIINSTSGIHDRDGNVVARVYLQQAQSFEAEGQWQKAIAACQEALKFNPKLAQAYKTWGDNLQKLGNITAAMGYYAKALAIKPDYAEVCLNLGSLSFQKQQWQLAVNYYQKAAEIEPDCVKAYRNLARAYKKLGQQQLMLDSWYQALQIEPTSAGVAEHCQLGAIMLETDRIDRAIACYRQAIKLKPNIGSIYLNLGQLLIKQDRLTEAIDLYQQGLKYLLRDRKLNFELAQLLTESNPNQAVIYYQQVIKIEPKFLPAYDNLAVIFTQQQRYPQAIQCYQQSLRLNPQNLTVWFKLAELLIRLKQWQPAILACQQGLKLDSKQWQLYHYLGIALLHLQQYSQGIKVYVQCLKLNSQEVDCYRNLGVALIAEKRWSEAIACYQQIAKFEPDDVEIYRKIGEAAMQTQQWSIALEAWNSAVELWDGDSWLYHHLGMTLVNLERWVEASIALQKSIELNPSFPWSYYHLGDALTKQQRWQESIEAYRYFLTQEANPYAYERLGDNLIKQIQLFTPAGKSTQEEACQCYYRAIEVDPDYVQPYYKLMELRPYDPEIAFMLAETYARQEKWSTAVIFYQMGLQVKADFPEIHLELGIVLEQLEQFDRAIAHYKEAIKLNPQEERYKSYLEKALDKLLETRRALSVHDE